jgi:FtsH-binding integral membrane protein
VLWQVATTRTAESAQGRAKVRFVPLKVVQFLALALTALALVPSGAHLFEFLNKMSLGAEQYFIVQNIYRGWNLFGIVLIAALIANLALALLLRGQGAPFALALFGFFPLLSRLSFSSSGPTRPIRRPTIGRRYRITGSNCAGSGSIRTPPMPS